MKKTLVSLAAVAALSTGAMAADKSIDIKATGQAVIYYETHSSGADKAPDIFDKDASAANVGVELNFGADLGNSFTLGTQISYIGTAGLENNLVVKTKQTAGNMGDTTSELALSKIFVAKKISNTTLKIGRQALPKSLSPLAFTEGWNVFKNSFDAILVVNSDVSDTTIVGAYVSSANSTVGDGLGSMTDLKVGGPAGLAVTRGAYMLSVQNNSVPMTTITTSYYHLIGIGGTDGEAHSGIAADALWFDTKIKGKDMPLGLCVNLQAGQISPDDDTMKDTTALGIKVGVKPLKPLMLSVAYTSVNNGSVAVKNVGTGIKTPLFTQMIYNQNAIARDADTVVVKGVYNMGDMGKIIAQYGVTSAGKTNINAENDYNELDLIYRVKSGGVSYWASVMHITTDKVSQKGILGGGLTDSDTKLRLWARKSF